MRILIFSHVFYPEVGAAQTRLQYMADALIEKGHDVEVLCPMPNYPTGKIFPDYKNKFYKEDKCGNILIHRYWIFTSNSMNLYHRLLSILSFAVNIWLFGFKRRLVKSYDVVIYQTPNLLPVYSGLLLFKKLYKKKAIVNISDIQPNDMIECGQLNKDGLKAKSLFWLQRRVYNMADGIMGQSEEIINQVHSVIGTKTKCFLYRNIQKTDKKHDVNYKKNNPFKIIYAGLIGPTQDILGIAKTINFEEIGCELHLYGGGIDVQALKEGIDNQDFHGVFYHGIVDRIAMDAILPQYDASIVPLKHAITGAVPSKIFDLIKSQVPILYSGKIGSEASNIILDNGVGFVSQYGDYQSLKSNIIKMKEMSDAEYKIIKMNELKASTEIFDFDKQIDGLNEYLKSYLK